MAENTYGFGGSEPTRDLNAGGFNASSPADGVKTSSGEAEDYLLSDQFKGKMADDQPVAGVSPVNGLMPGSDVCDSNWERQITGSEISYVGNTASVGAGPRTQLGEWPISPEKLGNGGAFSGRTLADRPSDGSWNQSATPGSEASSWAGGTSTSHQSDGY